MKNIVFLIISSYMFFGCNSCNDTFSQKVEDAVQRDSINKIVFVPDISIGKKLFLVYPPSIEESFGDMMSLMDNDMDYPSVHVFNKKGDEYLKMIFYPGNTANSISLFEVGYSSALTGKIKKTSALFDSFFTESQIALGMDKEELLKIKGDGYNIVSKKDTLQIRYVIDDFETSEFLKRYNMPIYSADYWIYGNKIVRYRFGFEYP